MTGSFILDYLILVFLSSIGVFQVAAVCNGFHGLLLLRNRRLCLLVGLALPVFAFTWFFLSGPRNLPDTAGGLDGNQQFGYFFAGLGAALALTLLMSSLSHRSLGADVQQLPTGLDALRGSNYLRALRRTMRAAILPRC